MCFCGGRDQTLGLVHVGKCSELHPQLSCFLLVILYSLMFFHVTIGGSLHTWFLQQIQNASMQKFLVLSSDISQA
jgi:hypothetical protein